MRIALLAIVGCAVPALAQVQVDVWTTDDGLPQNIVTGIHQTADGYLWIATLDGLARFDGVRFTVFNRANSPGIQNNRFTSLYEDAQGSLWLGTEAGSVTRYTRERFVTYTTEHGLERGIVQGFTGDAEGHVWALSGEAIKRWEPSRERFVEVEVPEPTFGYRRLLWGDRGGFWGLDRQGLRRFVGGRWELYPLPPPFDTGTVFVAEEQDGTIWLSIPPWQNSGRLRLGRMDPNGRFQAMVPRSPGDSPSSPAHRFVRRGRAERSWAFEIGADPEIHRRLEVMSPAGSEMMLFTVLYEDREGNLWLGTDGEGLYRVRRPVVTTYSRAHGLASRNVYTVLQDRDGAVWIGGWSPGSLSRFENGKFTNYTPLEGLTVSGVTALHQDRDGRLWVAAFSNLQTFHDGRFSPVDPDPAYEGAQVRAIHQDRAGAIWLGTDRGLVRRVDGRARLFTTRDGLASNDVRVIIDAPATGGLWIGGYGGLTHWRDGRFTAWTKANGLPGSTVRALYEDARGVLWIGTYDSGLVRFHDGGFTHYTTRVGLADDGVFQILDDGRGYFWMSSNRGIHRASKQELEELAAGARREISSIGYGESDGMLNAECNGGLWPAGVRTRDGRLWFPTQDGVAVIDPASVTTNPRPPPVVIEAFLLDRQPENLPAAGRPLRIPPGGTNFEIQYTGLSFINPERVRFRYKLAGLDEDWVEAGTRRAAYYPYVPPGRYVFTVTAANSDGVWNTEGASLMLVVLPPFYRTWWFVTLTSAAGATLVVTAWRRREMRLRRAHAAQQEFSRQLIASQEAERKRIAADLHDGLGQRLVIIKNLALLAGRSDAGHAGERVEEIASETSQAIAEVREISQHLRPYHLDHLGLTMSLEALVERAADATAIEFGCDLDSLDGQFPKEAEIDVYRVVQECLNNVLKHSGARSAWVTAKRSSSRLRITVRDDGRGFDPTTDDDHPTPGGFGLRGMMERVDLLGGRIDLRSAPGRGTIVTIEFDVNEPRETPPRERGEAAERSD